MTRTANLPLRLRMSGARLRQGAARRLRPPPPREALVARHAAGHSFLDVGCMWNVDGALCFAALDAGARTVTGVDVMAPTAGFAAEQARRGSRVRFVRGDLHDPALVAEAGRHEVVWCSGIVYHAPHPLLTIERLGDLVEPGGTLIVSSETIPEAPGLPQACVYYPHLPPAARRAFADPRTGARIGLDGPFDAARGYENWFWGLTPSALEAMLATHGLTVVERVCQPLHVALVARRDA